ncbi:uncharacterized protein PADG_00787 [Paracoccidioides brasiliensis Pb18]|uniref:Uncharacterized protein n=1 Tax=Paracoccidioides brasiliensis (strain Pb18) TaxID=502780 RepID=C1G1P7_PARBD|nr:uncharacterized protein PADG_00787 [Paracoccidioides brasiliensis Pb18]EEH44498.1 hypothetical protein PADG_00787 [Paracoccidioides brasiliensis Pb18]
MLVCPYRHDIEAFSGENQTNKKRTLTKAPGSPRKRARLDSSDDGKSPPINSQSTRKRRNTGNSSVALHRQRKVTSYAERSRRRALESQGRIEKTIFRIPQLIAQNKADLTKENDKTEDSEADEPVWDVLKQMKADAAAMSDDEQPQLPETPQAPQTPSRTWGIRGFLNSVPRTISKFIPTFTLSPNRSQSSVDVFTAPPESQMRPLPPAPINTPQQNEQSEPLEQSEQTPDDGSLTYSLFPEPLNRRELLGISSPRKEAHQPSPDQLISSVETESDNVQHASNSTTTNNTNRNKRKRRSTSPDEIPNPPGCSYGMDLRYFEYSSLSEADDDSLTNPDTTANIAQTRASIPASNPTPAPIHAPIPSTAQPAIRGILRNAKRVRFDASPENTPSKLRLRRNSDDSHQETESQDLSEPLINSLRNSSNDHSAPQSPAPTQPGRDQLSSPESVQEPAQPIEPSPMIIRPNPFGTYCLDYSVFSDSDEDLEEDVAAESATKESTAAAILSNTDNIAENQTPSVSSETEAPPFQPPPMTPTTATAVSAAPEPHTPATPVTPTVPTSRTDASTSQPPVFANNWTQLPPPRPTPANVSLPLSATPVGSDAVAKLRSRAEKYKPKLPSGLRASRRYSSSPVSACEGTDILGPQPEPIEPLGESPLPHLNAQGERQATEARSEAVVGKENLLGDLGRSSEQTSHVPDPHITQLVREMWLEEDEGAADQIFGREFRRYSREQFRLGEPGLVGGEREVEEEEEEGEEGEAAPIEPFNLRSYGEFCQELGEYRRERAS